MTSTLGNPTGLLARQFSYTLHKERDQYSIYCADGKPVHEYLDNKKRRLFILERHWGLRERILFYSYTTVTGWPLLLALVAGEAAIQV